MKKLIQNVARGCLWSATRFTPGQAERQDEKHLECADLSALCRFRPTLSPPPLHYSITPSLHSAHSITPLPQAVTCHGKPFSASTAQPARLVAQNNQENHSYTVLSPWYNFTENDGMPVVLLGRVSRGSASVPACGRWLVGPSRFPADGSAPAPIPTSGSVPTCGRCRLEGHAEPALSLPNVSWPRFCRAGMPRCCFGVSRRDTARRNTEGRIRYQA